MPLLSFFILIKINQMVCQILFPLGLVLAAFNGDGLTKFFHMSTIQRRRRNRITSLRDDVGNWLVEEGQIKNHIVNFYYSLYSTELTHCLRPHLLANSQFVPSDIAPFLENVVNRKEVMDAIFYFKPFKAPSPDILLPFFYQHFFNLVGESIVNFFRKHLLTTASLSV